ncbi:MAG: hypothetical protein AB7P14_29715 [Blastocatellales bacterium]
MRKVSQSWPRVWFCLPLLTLLVGAALGQCLIYDAAPYDESTELNYNWKAMVATCYGGPSCLPSVWYYHMQGNECLGIEDAWVYMARFVLETNDGIGASYTKRGRYSNLLYKYGGTRYYCSGVTISTDYTVNDCFPCDSEPLFLQSASCYNQDPNYAFCNVYGVCTASCLQPNPNMYIYAYDSCDYPMGGNHYCETSSYMTNPGSNTPGVFGSGVVMYIGMVWCDGHNYVFCDGSKDEYYNTCGCPEPQVL